MTSQPLYNILKNYQDNVSQGPIFSGNIPPRKLPPKEEWKDFLGYKVASLIGVPAGPLLTAEWVSLASQLGFDIPVYKTIRSTAHPSHPLPNILPVRIEKTHAIARDPKEPLSLEDLNITNSFGMPSQSPEFLMQDIAKANASLNDGQVMIVSIVGSEKEGRSLKEDFVTTATLAKEAGAQIIEANFSCPNVSSKAGSLYTSADSVYEIAKAIVQATFPIPLILKVGAFSSPELMRQVMTCAAQAGVRGFSGINTISLPVLTATGESALGSRKTSGICGTGIRQTALQFIETASHINSQEKLDLTLIGVGGITRKEHFPLFFEKGAHVAMTATGMMWDPYLALRYHGVIT